MKPREQKSAAALRVDVRFARRFSAGLHAAARMSEDFCTFELGPPAREQKQNPANPRGNRDSTRAPRPRVESKSLRSEIVRVDFSEKNASPRHKEASTFAPKVRAK
jgi:hypothetical protein